MVTQSFAPPLTTVALTAVLLPVAQVPPIAAAVAAAMSVAVLVLVVVVWRLSRKREEQLAREASEKVVKQVLERVR